MKKYLLAFRNLKMMLVSKNKLLFIVFFSIALSVFGMLFYSGYFLYSFYEAGAGGRIEIKLTDPADRARVAGLVEILEKDGLPLEKLYLTEDGSDGITVMGGYNREWDDHMLCGRNHTLTEDAPSVIMAEYLVDFVEDGETPVGMRTEKDGAEFTVSGIVPYTDVECYVLPVRYYAGHYDTDRVTAWYKNNLSPAEGRNLREALQREGGIETLALANSRNPFLSSEFVSEFVQVLLIFSVMVINAFCLAYYWITGFKKKFKIYAVCGARKKDIVKIAVLQTSMLMMGGTMLGNVFFVICKLAVRPFGLVYQGSYFPYGIVSLVVLAVMLLFSDLLAKKITGTDMIYHTLE
ncbi:MAG: hypothetical protein HFI88_09640 [Lachnospiraceae bacterium]|nr:hypothetical protein [Lachnospiraceae bacterium]